MHQKQPPANIAVSSFFASASKDCIRITPAGISKYCSILNNIFSPHNQTLSQNGVKSKQQKQREKTRISLKLYVRNSIVAFGEAILKSFQGNRTSLTVEFGHCRKGSLKGCQDIAAKDFVWRPLNAELVLCNG
jgi:hypothetical protein